MTVNHIYIYGQCGVESSLGQSDSSLTTTTLHQTKFNLQFEFDLARLTLTHIVLKIYPSVDCTFSL